MDVVDRLKKDLCNFARKKLNASYADIISLENIVEKYNCHAGEVDGLQIDCITTHNRVLAIRFDTNVYSQEEVTIISDYVKDIIKDNTTDVICIPNDIGLESMTNRDIEDIISKIKIIRLHRVAGSYRPLWNYDTTISLDGGEIWQT